MFEQSSALSELGPLHSAALKWFAEHQGQIVLWSDFEEQASLGVRLVTKAKGIYKPADSIYALSVRTTNEGPYPDREIEYRDDGSWVVQYFQENIDPSQRDKEATNRGLMRCMTDRVPVAFLIKRRPKPSVAYEVVGLGLVTRWEDGYFTIEGYPKAVAHPGATPARDATVARAQCATLAAEPVFDFDAYSDVDLRKRIITDVARRRGQASFRSALMAAYGGACCISGCDLSDALEAAHILPYRGPHSNHLQNGLLLRADLHTLFDLGHLAVLPDHSILVSKKVLNSATYRKLNGVKLRLPAIERQIPSAAALKMHRIWSGLVG